MILPPFGLISKSTNSGAGFSRLAYLLFPIGGLYPGLGLGLSLGLLEFLGDLVIGDIVKSVGMVSFPFTSFLFFWVLGFGVRAFLTDERFIITFSLLCVVIYLN